MRKVIFYSLVLAMSIVNGETFRVWSRRGMVVQRIYPVDTIPPSLTDTICQCCDSNHWDVAWGRCSRPNPWIKLYERDDAHWAGWNTRGIDPMYSPFPYAIDWYYCGPFKSFGPIARATLWISVDDFLLEARIRRWGTDTVYDLGVSVTDSGFNRLHRFDITDVLRKLMPSGSTYPGYQFEFCVLNTECCRTGLIFYLSADRGDSVRYTYQGHVAAHDPYQYFSMPFRPTNPRATLRSIFVSIDQAIIYNPNTHSYEFFPIDSPLVGPIGDKFRTYSFGIRFTTTGYFSRTVWGYPIYEQRYLDQKTDDSLFFSSVNCNIKFWGSHPDDYPDGKIRSDSTWWFRSGTDGGRWVRPDTMIMPLFANKTKPINMGSSSIPYSLDLACSFGVLAMENQDTLEPYIPIHSEEEIRRILDLAERMPLSSIDTAEIVGYMNELDRISALPSEDADTSDAFHKRDKEQNGKTDKFALHAIHLRSTKVFQLF